MQEYPFGKNDIPPSSAFAGQLNGNIIWGTPVQLPNFYANYSVAYDKPMVVAETGAFYNLCDVFPGRMGCAANANGPTQLQVKSAWWQQAFNLMDAPQGPSIATAFPNIKLISWYDVTMRQVEASGNTVDWDVSQQADLRTAFVQYIQTPLVDANGQSIQYWKFAGDWRNQEGLVLPSFSPPPSSPPHPRPPKSPNSTHPKPKSPKHKSPKPPKSPTSKVGRRFMM